MSAFSLASQAGEGSRHAVRVEIVMWESSHGWVWPFDGEQWLAMIIHNSLFTFYSHYSSNSLSCWVCAEHVGLADR